MPEGYPEATEKYGGQTQVVKLPDGHYDLKNYIAGMPFPNPWILTRAEDSADPGTDLCRIAAGTPDTGLASLCSLDRFGSTTCLRTAYVYRMLSHIYSPGYPVTEPKVGGSLVQ